jgi:hypothetical protein
MPGRFMGVLAVDIEGRHDPPATVPNAPSIRWRESGWNERRAAPLH